MRQKVRARFNATEEKRKAHAATGGGGACYTVWGTTSCGAGHTQIYSGISVNTIFVQTYQYGTGLTDDPAPGGISASQCINTTSITDNGTATFPSVGSTTSQTFFMMVGTGTNTKYAPNNASLDCALCCQ